MTEREQIFNKYNGRCAYCGCQLEKRWHEDHMQPIRRTQTLKGFTKFNVPIYEVTFDKSLDTIDNKNPACVSCNVNKKDRSIEQFRGHILSMRKNLKHNTNYKIGLRYGIIEEVEKPVVFYFEKV